MRSASRTLNTKCKKVKDNMIVFRNLVIIIAAFIITTGSLFYITSVPSKIDIRLTNKIFNNEFLGIAYNETTTEFYNETLTAEKYIVSGIDLFLSNVETKLSKEDMIQKVIYNQNVPSENGINSLHIPIYQYNENNVSEAQNPSLTRSRKYDCQNGFVLSYLKIQITLNVSNSTSIVDLYHFFQGDINIATKMNIITYIHCFNFEFDINAYKDWYNWKTGITTEIPSTYPYNIVVEIYNYTNIKNPIDGNEYILQW